MNNKDHAGSKGNGGTETKHKGESGQSKQKGAESISQQAAGKHRKDESDGAEKATTKKGSNSI
jgi:hypothetical protein